MRTINQYIEENKRNIKIDLTTVNINGFTQPFRVVWLHGVIQDISAFHNIDVEGELTAILSEEIVGDNDREILNNVINMGLNV